MKYIKLFESFNEKDEVNISISKVKKKKDVELDESFSDDPKFAETEKELEKLFKKLVPGNGAAETLEGEMVRAIMRILYRYFNDGDYFFRGYGKETVLPSVTYLKTKSPLAKELKSIFIDAQKNALPNTRPGKYFFNADEYTIKDGYLNKLKEATKLIVDYVVAKKGKYTPNTDHDSR